jgi:hypothetical protein
MPPGILFVSIDSASNPVPHSVVTGDWIASHWVAHNSEMNGIDSSQQSATIGWALWVQLEARRAYLQEICKNVWAF